MRIVDALQSVQHLCHTFKNSSGERGLRLLLTSPKFSAIASAFRSEEPFLREVQRTYYLHNFVHCTGGIIFFEIFADF